MGEKSNYIILLLHGYVLLPIILNIYIIGIIYFFAAEERVKNKPDEFMFEKGE